MNFLVFSAICVGLASAGGIHSEHRSSSSYGAQHQQQQQRQLVDVPYTVEIRSSGSSNAGSSRNYGASRSLGRSYQQQPQPQVQIQRIESVPLVHQSTSTVSQSRRQPQQLVEIPYTIETTRSSGNSDSGLRFLPYSAGNSIQIQAPQQRQQQQQQRSSYGNQHQQQRSYGNQQQQQRSYGNQQQQQRSSYGNQQLVDVPYTVEVTRSRNSNAGVRRSSAPAYRSTAQNSIQIQPAQQVPLQQVQLVQIPYQVISSGISTTDNLGAGYSLGGGTTLQPTVPLGSGGLNQLDISPYLIY